MVQLFGKCYTNAGKLRKGWHQMIKLYVEEMNCSHCVERIHKALEAIGVEHVIQLENKTVVIDGCENCAGKAIEKLDEIGFTARIEE